uniref:SGNH/GDSL hydrolase family protein n=1 Tax=Algoriphagus sp. TaxID=1872435 RepID=UPI0025884105
MKQILKAKWQFIIVLFLFLSLGCTPEKTLDLQKNASIALVGNNLGSRMMEFGLFETEMHLRYPDSTLFIRNLCDPGDTPGFRPRSASQDPWAFPGAEEFQDEYATYSDSQGFLEKPDQWLTRLKADIVVGFFGFNESFQGKDKLQNFKDELEAWVIHSKAQQYNGKSAPQLALVSPIAFEDLSAVKDVPDGKKENEILKLYTEAMAEVAKKHELFFVNAFEPSQKWYADSEEPLTIDGTQLNEAGYAKLAELLADKLFGKAERKAEANRELIHQVVMEKNWLWHNDYKIPNGVHVYGRRYDPFGPDNYPFEIEKIRQMTAIRDTAIWDANQGKVKDLATADAKTRSLPEVK